MQSIEVLLGPRTYQIQIGAAKPGELAKTIGRWTPAPSKIVIVYDQRIDTLATGIANDPGWGELNRCLIEIPSGEGSKSIPYLEHLWKRLFQCGADRKAVLVAVGGGVIGDLAGFAAATWNRGIRLVQVPTTLLAMVDSSVGGKTGINLPDAKNVIGCFWQPAMVWSDVSSLQSLPTREFLSGLAEVVKYGVILDSDFFAYLEDHADAILCRQEPTLVEVIRRCCMLKAGVVAHDEFETSGHRAILNYGHTFGHAIESLTDYGSLLHGEAVTIGMTMAGHLAATLGRWPSQSFERQTRLLQRLGLPIQIPGNLASVLTADRMMEKMSHDKKNAYGQLNLILPSRLGEVQTVSGIPGELVRGSIEACIIAC